MKNKKNKLVEKFYEVTKEMDRKTVWSTLVLFIIVFWGCAIWIIKSFL